MLLPPATPVLRAYQVAAVEAVLAARDRGERCGLVAMPTGAGKTVVAAEVLRRLSDRALVVAHTGVLVTQLREALSAYLAEPVGLVLEGAIEHSDARVVVASRQSLTAQRLETIAASAPFETLVFDEAHHAAHESEYSRLLEALRSTQLFVLGLTATPWRESGQLLFEQWWFSREIADLIPLGVLAPVRYEVVALPLRLREVRLSDSAGRDYSSKALEPPLLAVVDATAARIAPLVRDRRHVVVFAATVQHAHALARALDRSGVSAAAVWGAQKTGDRDEVLQRWRAGGIVALINVGIVTEGFDEPRISAIVFARPTASTLFYMQALGRGLRIAPGKRECLVIDAVGLGDLRDARQCTLDALVPEVAALGISQPPAEYRGRRVVSKPGDDGAHLWLKIAPDAYVLNVEARASIFVIRECKSGLYRTTLVEGPSIEELARAPFSVILSVVREQLRGRNLTLCKRAAPWRRRPATQAQLRELARLSPPIGDRASREAWNCGRASSAIATLKARRLARRLGLLPLTEAA